MEILLSPRFLVSVFIKTSFIVLSGSSQIELKLGSPNFLPEQPHDIFVVPLRGQLLLPKVINPLFLTDRKPQLCVQLSWSSSPLGHLSAHGDSLLLYL